MDWTIVLLLPCLLHKLLRNLNELFSQRPLLRNLFQYRAPPGRQVPAPHPTQRILPCKLQQLSLKQVLPNPDVIQLVQRFLARLAVSSGIIG